MCSWQTHNTLFTSTEEITLCMCVCVHGITLLHVCLHVCVQVYACICMYASMCAYMHGACVTYVCMYVCVCVCVCECVCVCVCVHVRVPVYICHSLCISVCSSFVAHSVLLHSFISLPLHTMPCILYICTYVYYRGTSE